MKIQRIFFVIIVIGALLGSTALVSAQMDAPQGANAPADSGFFGTDNSIGNGFIYQGQLKDDAGNPVNASCDFRFTLWDANTAGTAIGAESLAAGVVVSDGSFTTIVNSESEFGTEAFTGEERWLEIGVRCPTGSGEYTTLSPRQPLTAVPYANFALNIPFAGTGGANTAADSDHDHWGQSWNSPSGSGTGLNLFGGTTGLQGSGTDLGVYGSTDAGWGVVGDSASGVGVGGNGGSVGVRGTSIYEP